MREKEQNRVHLMAMTYSMDPDSEQFTTAKNTHTQMQTHPPTRFVYLIQKAVSNIRPLLEHPEKLKNFH